MKHIKLILHDSMSKSNTQYEGLEFTEQNIRYMFKSYGPKVLKKILIIYKALKIYEKRENKNYRFTWMNSYRNAKKKGAIIEIGLYTFHGDECFFNATHMIIYNNNKCELRHLVTQTTFIFNAEHFLHLEESIYKNVLQQLDTHPTLKLFLKK